MAKGLRASTRKRNNKVLREKVFGPAIDARTERLSSKLQEIAAQPRLAQDKEMDVDEDATDEQDIDATSQAKDDDVEMKGTRSTRKIKKKPSSHRIGGGVTKKKPRNSIVFPASAAKRKRIAQSKKKSA